MELQEVTFWDFPAGSVVKTPHSQCRGPGFNPWSGNWIPHATTKSPHAATKTWCSQINTHLKKKKELTYPAAVPNSCHFLSFHWKSKLSLCFPDMFHLSEIVFQKTYCVIQKNSFVSPHWKNLWLSKALVSSLKKNLLKAFTFQVRKEEKANTTHRWWKTW